MSGSETQRRTAGQAKPSVLDGIIARVEAVLDEEAARLRSGGVSSFLEYNAAKSQGLLELGRALKALPPQEVRRAAAGLARLRQAADSNRAALAVQVEAAKSVVATVTRALREAESDGTYSSSVLKTGRGA